MIEYVIHTTTTASSKPLCGAEDPGPVPFGQALKIKPCDECLKVGPKGLPHDQTMEHHLNMTRARLRQKLRGMPAQERADYHEQVIAIASAGLADPSAAPALFTTPQLMAALYAIGAVRSGFWTLKRAGIRPTWALLDQGLVEIELLTVALAEGCPE